MRAREFLMKDAYSFDANKASLQETYDAMYTAYSHIFSRLGLEFRIVLADTGSIGGSGSHEFHVLAASGEDQIAFSNESDYAANVELAESLKPSTQPKPPQQAVTNKWIRLICVSLRKLAAYLKVMPQQIVKTLIVKGTDEPFVALLIRGDHELNPIKAQKLPKLQIHFVLRVQKKFQNLGYEAWIYWTDWFKASSHCRS